MDRSILFPLTRTTIIRRRRRNEKKKKKKKKRFWQFVGSEVRGIKCLEGTWLEFPVV